MCYDRENPAKEPSAVAVRSEEPAVPPLSRHSRYWQILLAVAVLALLVRLVVSFELANHPSVVDPDPRTDMATYQEKAKAILSGDWPERFYYQPLYYAVFLPAVYALSGSSSWAVPAAQSVLGAATAVLAGITATWLFGRRTGYVAAVLTALARMHVFYTPFSLMTVLLSFEVALFVCLLVLAVRRKSAVLWLVVAFVLSCAALTRGNLILLLPLVLGFLAWRHREAPLRAGFLIVLVVAVFAAPRLPFSIRNYQHYGRWTGPSSAADAVLALSNSPQAPPGGLAPDTAVFHEWMRQAEATGDERIPVVRQVLSWAARSPLAFAELKWQTLLLFWSAFEIPNNVALAYEGQASRFIRLPFPFQLDFSVLGTLAIAGLLLSLAQLRGSVGVLAVFTSVLLYCGATILFYMLARFRTPLVPVLCIFAAYACRQGVCLAADFMEGKPGLRHRLVGTAAAVTAGIYICNGAYGHYQAIEPAVMRVVRPYGTAFETRNGAVVHDHGPRLTGGWMPMEIPPSGTVVEKQFRMPPWLREGQWETLALDVAAHDGGGASPMWRTVSASVERSEGGTVHVRFHIRPGGAGDVLFLDVDRYYGRTRIRGLDKHPSGELVSRLRLVRSASGSQSAKSDTAPVPTFQQPPTQQESANEKR